MFVFVSLLFTREVIAQNRYASCDACGLCQKDGQLFPTPGSWEACRDCIYPGASGMETLLIEPTAGIPPTPAIGQHYTSLGCINTALGDFTQPGAAAGLSTLLLGFIFRIAGGIAFLYLLYGAFLILTSQSNPERLEQGKKTVFGAVVGLVFVLMSVFITNFVANQILKIPTG